MIHEIMVRVRINSTWTLGSISNEVGTRCEYAIRGSTSMIGEVESVSVVRAKTLAEKPEPTARG